MKGEIKGLKIVIEACVWIIHFNDVISFQPHSVAHGGAGSRSGFALNSVTRTLNL